MNEERRLEELEQMNRELLDANTSLRRSQASLDGMLSEIRQKGFLFFALLLGIILLVSLYPLAWSYSRVVFNPTDVPADYNQVNRYVLKNAGKDTKVFWLPSFKQGFTYQWAPEKRIGPFNSLSSNPSIGNIHDPFRTDSYINWIEQLWQPFMPTVGLMQQDMMVRRDVDSRLLFPLSPRYVIVDSSVPGYDFTTPLSLDMSLKSVYKAGNLQVFEVNDYQGDVWAADQTLRVYDYWDHLSIMQKLGPANLGGIAFANAIDSNSSRYPQTDMRAYLGDNLVANGSFEKGYGFNPFLSWTTPIKDVDYQVFRDFKEKVSGKLSIRVENRSKQAYKTGWVVGDQIAVQSGSVYSFDSNVKYSNVNWTDIVLEGYQPQTRKWSQIAQCPGIQARSQDWKKYHVSIYVPPGITMIRVLLGAGWVYDASKGAAVSWFDDIKLRKVDDAFFDKIMEEKNKPGVKVSYVKLGPTKYKAHIENPTQDPFVLVLGEAHDPWVARLPNGKSVRAVKLYSTICGFPINISGRFDVVIEYPQEKWLGVGFLITAPVLLLCVAYLFAFWYKRSVSLRKRFPDHWQPPGAPGSSLGVQKGMPTARGESTEN